jgi:hypothetical protein
MIGLDHYILDFVKNNWITIWLGLTLLKGVAIITPTTKDDKIVTLLSNMFGAIRSGRDSTISNSLCDATVEDKPEVSLKDKDENKDKDKDEDEGSGSVNSINESAERLMRGE